MNNDPILCSSCGASLDAAAPGGLCPRCLMARAMIPTESLTGPRATPPTVEQVAAAFPTLDVFELIGAGGMGAVFRARQLKLNRLVALKVLPASLAARDPAFAERFEREGQMLARLHHPNIVAVYDSGRAGDFFYLLMEHVDGVNLREAMRASRFTPAQALAIVPRICDALQFAHDEGVLHRDIKPENILLDAKGRVKLADFGVGKMLGEAAELGATRSAPAPPGGALTQAGTALGTPQYMAPEQREHPDTVDHRADIYSLGVVFYELLTGELPVGKFAPPSEKSATDPRVDTIVQQALEQERERRQQSAGEVRTQVETIASSPPANSSAQRMPERSEPEKTRPLRVALSVAATIAFVCLLAFFLSAGRRDFTTPAESASAERWSPPISPGEQVSLEKIYEETGDLARRGRYEEALQRHLWYHDHALEIDPAQSGVRLSFWLNNWMELARRYPKAKQALIEVRDRGTSGFAGGGGNFDLFMEVSSINAQLGDRDATYLLFKSIHAQDPQLASQCYALVEDALVERGDYALCTSFIPDFLKRFETICAVRQRTLEIADRTQEANRVSVREQAQRAFIKDTRKLAEILVGVGRKADAETIRDRAVALLDVPGLRSVVEDAEQNVAKRPTSAGSRRSAQALGSLRLIGALGYKNVAIARTESLAGHPLHQVIARFSGPGLSPEQIGDPGLVSGPLLVPSAEQRIDGESPAPFRSDLQVTNTASAFSFECPGECQLRFAFSGEDLARQAAEQIKTALAQPVSLIPGTGLPLFNVGPWKGWLETSRFRPVPGRFTFFPHPGRSPAKVPGSNWIDSAVATIPPNSRLVITGNYVLDGFSQPQHEFSTTLTSGPDEPGIYWFTWYCLPNPQRADDGPKEAWELCIHDATTGQELHRVHPPEPLQGGWQRRGWTESVNLASNTRFALNFFERTSQPERLGQRPSAFFLEMIMP